MEIPNCLQYWAKVGHNFLQINTPIWKFLTAYNCGQKWGKTFCNILARAIIVTLGFGRPRIKRSNFRSDISDKSMAALLTVYLVKVPSFTLCLAKMGVYFFWLAVTSLL